jgi:hypothetical protein
MSVLINHGIRHEICYYNPIRLVRQSAKRKKLPAVLSASEVRQLIASLGLRERTLVLLDAGKRSQFTNEELRVGSVASFARRRLQPPDLTELHAPFCAYKNSSGCPKTLAIRQTEPEIGDGVVRFCACAKSGRSP